MARVAKTGWTQLPSFTHPPNMRRTNTDGSISISTIIATDTINTVRVICPTSVTSSRLKRTCTTHTTQQYPHRIQFPTSSVDPTPRDSILLPPESIGPNQSHENSHTVTRDREGFANLTKPKTIRQRLRSLQTEQLRNQNALLGNDERGPYIREECPLQSLDAESVLCR